MDTTVAQWTLKIFDFPELPCKYFLKFPIFLKDEHFFVLIKTLFKLKKNYVRNRAIYLFDYDGRYELRWFFLLMRIFDELLGGRFNGISETG